MFIVKSSDEDDSDEDDSDDDDDDESETFEDEGDEKERELAATSEDDEDKKRKTMAIILFCCCIFLIAIAVGLGVGLSKKNDDDPASVPTTLPPTPVPVPTAPPVRMPVSLPPRSPLPTDAPTLAGSPPPFEPVIVESSADTTIYRDGFDAGGPQGSEETMLVQSGVPGNADLPSAFSLVQFDLDSAIPTDVDSFLCLGHVQGDDIVDEESSVTYRACSLPPTDVDIESLTGSDVSYTIPEDCVSEVVLFDVTPQDDVVCFNVAPTLVTQRVRLRGRQRQLQSSTSYLFMLDSPPGSEQPGDRFYTRNSADTSLRPTLEVGTEIPKTDVPTTNLTQTLPPDTLPPSNTTAGDFPPCGVCAEEQEVTLPDASLPVPPELLPPGIEPEQATCGFVDQFCMNGGCSPDICTTIEQATAAISPLCGCSVEI